MKAAEVRNRFVNHFVKYGHDVVPGVPLPFDDPNLLVVNSGMVQFVPYYSGDIDPPWVRATSVQKCVRTIDIEEVGKTTRHGTFFQMAGNFCFGDYFREEAIAMAWELSTSPVEEGGFGLDPERIWPTVFETDDEAYDLWHHKIGVPKERIQRRGMEDNLWSMGIPGPCGPSSELFYDRGPAFGAEGGPEVDEDRYMEFWNLVFMTSIRGPGQTKSDYQLVGKLPHNNIDTGLGVERMATLLQGVDNLYEIDETYPVLRRATELSDRVYSGSGTSDHSAQAQTDVQFRVIADHVRTALMLIGDGISPGNEGRGYVLRRIMRRAIRAARLVGITGPVFPELLPISRDAMSPSYPELDTDYDRIAMIAYGEEDAFLRTLSSGTTILDLAVRQTKERGGSLPGKEAFTLHDTYGFPIDLTVEIAAEHGLTVDESEFRRLMTEQRQRAKDDARARKSGGADMSVYRDFGPTQFVGYESLEADAKVLGVIKDGELVRVATPGEIVEVVLDRTSFYAESGGQVADEGVIELGDARLRVLDAQKALKELVVHRVQVESGELTAGLAARTLVDPEWRLAARQAHSGTHVVHAALREVLGPTALQSGSYNKPGYLRLDFAWSRALDGLDLRGVEESANAALRRDLPVTVEYMTLGRARELGALALFGETYDSTSVRVVEMGGAWSRELCGGTHVEHTSQIGIVTLTGDSSVGAGVRRLEGHVGIDAVRFLANERSLVSNLSSLLKVSSGELVDRVSGLVQRLRAVEKELVQIRSARLAAEASALVDCAETVHGARVLTTALPSDQQAGDVRTVTVKTANGITDAPAVVLFTSLSDGQITCVCAVNKPGVKAGLSAASLLERFAAATGGRGGGSAAVAQGGGGDPRSIEAGFRAVAALVSETMPH
ncbi:alanine--tRNA ligase [Actinokineospora inagensis]|uniref:alanine--tRNA ligase n=1 Tax=Actinokineospora inagensis TaxID=103730 RepID=UPI0003F8010D|nr:alanine--tRNA ligase [Actinokineospora inagensis]